MAAMMRGRLGATITVLSIGIIVVGLFSLGLGQLNLNPMEVLYILLKPLGIDLGITLDNPYAEAGFWSIRPPRLLMSLLVGIALAVSGLLMQAVFGNPLAEPGVVGVSSGAALGAASAIVLGLTFLGEWTIPVLAFIGGLITTLIVYTFSRNKGKTEVVTLLLAGIAINAFAGAGIAFLSFLGDTQSREQIVFWQLGSLNGSRWIHVAVVVVPIVLGVIISFFLVGKLDLLSLGEKSARHLGVNVERLRLVTIILVAFMVAAAVSFAGIISFVGLVVPHLMRMILGPRHLPLLITSVLGGGLLLMLADLGARTLINMSDLPIGMFTALVGGPFFFYLLYRNRKAAGGWG